MANIYYIHQVFEFIHENLYYLNEKYFELEERKNMFNVDVDKITKVILFIIEKFNEKKQLCFDALHNKKYFSKKNLFDIAKFIDNLLDYYVEHFKNQISLEHLHYIQGKITNFGTIKGYKSFQILLLDKTI